MADTSTQEAAQAWSESVSPLGWPMWQKDAPDGRLTVLITREPAGRAGRMLWHLSISHPARYPSWDEIHGARYDLLPEDITVAMLLPPKSEYVNFHAHCFHLWETESD